LEPKEALPGLIVVPVAVKLLGPVQAKETALGADTLQIIGAFEQYGPVLVATTTGAGITIIFVEAVAEQAPTDTVTT
jgi:hypothetical protein